MFKISTILKYFKNIKPIFFFINFPFNYKRVYTLKKQKTKKNKCNYYIIEKCI